MQSLARSLSLTAALTYAIVIGLFLAAAPQEKPRAFTLAPAAPPAKRTAATTAPPAPIAFADPDGQELILEDLSVRTAIHGMLSLTELYIVVALVGSTPTGSWGLPLSDAPPSSNVIFGLIPGLVGSRFSLNSDSALSGLSRSAAIRRVTSDQMARSAKRFSSSSV